MMNYCYRGFSQQSIKGKVLDPFPWVSPGKEGKAVTHNCNVPYIRDCDCTRLRISADNVGSAPPPVPGNECDIRRKLVSLHQGQKFPEVHKPMRRLQQRVVDN